MYIMGINRILKIVQVYNDGRKYTCSIIERDGEEYFCFKNEWHKVADYTTSNTSEFKL